MASLFTPNPAVNYTFLAAVYALLTVVTAVLYWLQAAGITTLVNGMWIVPAPAFPCLLYALAMRSKAAAAPPPAAAAPASESKKSK